MVSGGKPGGGPWHSVNKILIAVVKWMTWGLVVFSGGGEVATWGGRQCELGWLVVLRLVPLLLGRLWEGLSSFSLLGSLGSFTSADIYGNGICLAKQILTRSTAKNTSSAACAVYRGVDDLSLPLFYGKCVHSLTTSRRRRFIAPTREQLTYVDDDDAPTR